MGMMETLIRRFTPDQVLPHVSTPTSAPPDEYPREVLRVIATTWTMAMSHFNGERRQLALAEMYCGAVRERLLDELESVRRPSSVLLGDVLGWTQPSAATAQAFARLSPKSFDDSYARLRIEYARNYVDIEQVADALIQVVDVMRWITNHR
jgi:hypothetical protein